MREIDSEIALQNAREASPQAHSVPFTSREFGSFPVPGMVDIDDIKIHRQPGHISHEQVDRRPAFEGEQRILKNVRRGFQQQPDRVNVDSIHQDLSVRVLPSLSREDQREVAGGTALRAAGAQSSCSSSAH